jgi:transcriptional regulator with XRE-family HTH domain
MAQVAAVIKTLKKELKAQGKTYVDVAELLDLSEASVKRIFAEENFTLQRLEACCHLIGLEMTDLLQKMASEQQRISQLTEDQEKVIVSDLILMLVTVCVINGFTFEDIINRYTIEHTECIQKLATLDRLKLIELLPNNRIKLLIAPNFSWLPNGPIQEFFRKTVEKEFFTSDFSKESENLIVLNGLLSKSGNAVFQKKMQRLTAEFTELLKADFELPCDQRDGCTVILAIREWQYSFYEGIHRSGTTLKQGVNG